MELLRIQWSASRFLCTGLDSDLEKVLKFIRRRTDEGTLSDFNEQIFWATQEYASCYKPNRAFYAELGEAGHRALRRTIDRIHLESPNTPIILDAKEGDIDNTNKGYVTEAFTEFEADAITVHPTMGLEAMRPFLDCKDKGIIVLVRTSNKGAGEFQDRKVLVTIDELKRLLIDDTNAHQQAEELLWGFQPNMYLVPMYQYVAMRVARFWNYNNNCAIVVGATAPEELKIVRKLVGNMPILLPGIGAQGGEIQATVEAGQDENGEGMIINVSRSLIFPKVGSNFLQAVREEAKRLHEEINRYRRTKMAA